MYGRIPLACERKKRSTRDSQHGTMLVHRAMTVLAANNAAQTFGVNRVPQVCFKCTEFPQHLLQPLSNIVKHCPPVRNPTALAPGACPTGRQARQAAPPHPQRTAAHAGHLQQAGVANGNAQLMETLAQCQLLTLIRSAHRLILSVSQAGFDCKISVQRCTLTSANSSAHPRELGSA